MFLLSADRSLTAPLAIGSTGISFTHTETPGMAMQLAYNITTPFAGSYNVALLPRYEFV